MGARELAADPGAGDVADPNAGPALSGALEGLRFLGPADLPRYTSAVEAGQQLGWGYYFPYLMTRHRAGESAVLIEEDAGSICVYLWRKRKTTPKLDLLVAPAPINPQVVARCIERANDYNASRTARVMRVDAQDRGAFVDMPWMSLRPRKPQYLYSPEAFGDLAGRKYRTLRRNVATVEESSEVEVVPFAREHEKACRKLLRRWGKHHREAHGSAGGVGASGRALDLATSLPEADIRGEVILIDGKVRAFGLGGAIRPGVGCFFDAKSDNGIPGLAYFQRYSFLSNQRDLALINDGSDVGRAGLRQLKQSLRPVGMHEEFRAYQGDD